MREEFHSDKSRIIWLKTGKTGKTGRSRQIRKLIRIQFWLEMGTKKIKRLDFLFRPFWLKIGKISKKPEFPVETGTGTGIARIQNVRHICRNVYTKFHRDGSNGYKDINGYVGREE